MCLAANKSGGYRAALLAFLLAFAFALAFPFAFAFGLALCLAFGAGAPFAWAEAFGCTAGLGRVPQTLLQVGDLVVLVLDASGCFVVGRGAVDDSVALTLGRWLGGSFGASWPDREEGVNLVLLQDGLEVWLHWFYCVHKLDA